MKELQQFHKLFEPGHIGKLEVKNRIVMAPMGTAFTGPDGRFSQKHIDYYVARAKGGTGLIITECVKVESNIELPMQTLHPALDSSAMVPRANELVEFVHDYDAKIAIQLSVGFGRNAYYAAGTIPVSASAVPSFMNPNVLCRELTKDEIKKIVKAFIEAAERAVIASFDMIEIHAHAGYILDQFMSSVWNKRNDEYGGDLNGRMRFAEELISATRAKVGADFPLGFRFSGEHKFQGGRTLEESKEIAQRLEAMGIDALHVDAGSYESMPWIFPPIYWPQGCMVDLAAAIKQVVSIPVITVGGITRPNLAEQILEERKADFIALGRQLLADPDWPNKAREGRVRDIIPCIRCNEYCVGRAFVCKPVSCSVNPTVGKERYYDIKHAESRKRVMVVGGGPAGMQAARIAALKGHDVTLYEKEKELGGQLRAASKPIFKSDVAELVSYLAHQLRTLGVKVELGKEVTPQLLDVVQPEAVVVATGAVPLKCDIPGIESEKVVTALDFELGRKKVTGKNIVIAGGGLVGCETALVLAQEGKKVTIIEMLSEVALDLTAISRIVLLSMLSEKGIAIHTNMTVTEFNSEGLKATDQEGRQHVFKADTVICALGSVSENRLQKDIDGKVRELYVVGDCVSPRKIGEAMHEGFVAGWRV